MIEYLRTGEAPPLSICGEQPVASEGYSQAVDALTEALLDREILDAQEVARIVESGLRRLEM